MKNSYYIDFDKIETPDGAHPMWLLNCALLLSIYFPGLCCIGCLLYCKPNTNLRVDGKPVLSIAADLKKSDTSPLIIDQLLKNGADPHAIDREGKTALDYAQESYFKEAIVLLRKSMREKKKNENSK